jgi:hypothetical protein
MAYLPQDAPGPEQTTYLYFIAFAQLALGTICFYPREFLDVSEVNNKVNICIQYKHDAR